MEPRYEPASPYERIGREAGVRRLVASFYDFMDRLPEAQTIREMHADDLDPMIEKLTCFLVGWMGGPEHYRERYGRVIIPAAHQQFPIDRDARDQWLLCMRCALEAIDAEPDLIDLLMPPFAEMADMCRSH